MRQVSLHGPKIIKSHCHHNILFLACQLIQRHWTEVEHTSTSLHNVFMLSTKMYTPRPVSTVPA